MKEKQKQLFELQKITREPPLVLKRHPKRDSDSEQNGNKSESDEDDDDDDYDSFANLPPNESDDDSENATQIWRDHEQTERVNEYIAAKKKRITEMRDKQVAQETTQISQPSISINDQKPNKQPIESTGFINLASIAQFYESKETYAQWMNQITNSIFHGGINIIWFLWGWGLKTQRIEQLDFMNRAKKLNESQLQPLNGKSNDDFKEILNNQSDGIGMGAGVLSRNRGKSEIDKLPKGNRNELESSESVIHRQKMQLQRDIKDKHRKQIIMMCASPEGFMRYKRENNLLTNIRNPADFRISKTPRSRQSQASQHNKNQLTAEQYLQSISQTENLLRVVPTAPNPQQTRAQENSQVNLSPKNTRIMHTLERRLDFLEKFQSKKSQLQSQAYPINQTSSPPRTSNSQGSMIKLKMISQSRASQLESIDNKSSAYERVNNQVSIPQKIVVGSTGERDTSKISPPHKDTQKPESIISQKQIRIVMNDRSISPFQFEKDVFPPSQSNNKPMSRQLPRILGGEKPSPFRRLGNETKINDSSINLTKSNLFHNEQPEVEVESKNKESRYEQNVSLGRRTKSSSGKTRIEVDAQVGIRKSTQENSTHKDQGFFVHSKNIRRNRGFSQFHQTEIIQLNNIDTSQSFLQKDTSQKQTQNRYNLQFRPYPSQIPQTSQSKSPKQRSFLAQFSNVHPHFHDTTPQSWKTELRDGGKAIYNDDLPSHIFGVTEISEIPKALEEVTTSISEAFRSGKKLENPGILKSFYAGLRGILNLEIASKPLSDESNKARVQVLKEKKKQLLAIEHQIANTIILNESLDTSSKRIQLLQESYANILENIDFYMAIVDQFEFPEQNTSLIMLKMKQNEYAELAEIQDHSVVQYRKDLFNPLNPQNSITDQRRSRMKKIKELIQIKKARFAQE